MTTFTPPLGARRGLCACCGKYEAGIDGLCISCRRSLLALRRLERTRILRRSM